MMDEILRESEGIPRPPEQPNEEEEASTRQSGATTLTISLYYTPRYRFARNKTAPKPPLFVPNVSVY